MINNSGAISSVYDKDAKISEVLTDYSKLYKSAEVAAYHENHCGENL